jgi:hypothetical protein
LSLLSAYFNSSMYLMMSCFSSSDTLALFMKFAFEITLVARLFAVVASLYRDG